MKKLNWGHWIAIVLGVFLVLNVIMVIFTFSQDVELVTDNYYEKELKYQDELGKMNKALALPDSLKMSMDRFELNISYPQSLLKNKLVGTIHLYRPDQRKFDYDVDVKYDDSGRQTINMSGKAPGKWKISISLNDGEHDYLFKDVIFLQ
ncbi:MAG: hypothetical protein HBSAPP04_12650 [Ignavibacteriaceae bacterium]|nr:MAG: hypothetical protein EDM75_05830 [Chlorobiota bacterium]GJQ32426.1 MAG: hypothetical protein HBSAPP04_12650 [Ignavibacteriaceae bacterium]